MKKLYGKGKIHPSPPPTSDHLSLLPAAVLTLAVALSPEDRQVLAYLISCSGTSNNFSGEPNTHPKSSAAGGGGHPPNFHCNCFTCYMSYWVRWDNSPNRQLIHEIIDAYEDGLFLKKHTKNKKERRKRICKNSDVEKRDSGESDSAEVSSLGDADKGGGDGEVGSMRKLVSFIGERIWGVWGV